MKVRIINKKIAEFNTKNSNIELPQDFIGTHFSKYIYENDSWSIDPIWIRSENLIGGENQNDVSSLYHYINSNDVSNLNNTEIINNWNLYKENMNDILFN